MPVDFFVAGRLLKGWQNGLAISGDYMSAASFLGIAGLVSLFGFDGLLHSFGFIVGWVIVILLVAEPLRNSGKYTLSYIMAFRLKTPAVRGAAALSSIIIGLFYLLAVSRCVCLHPIGEEPNLSTPAFAFALLMRETRFLRLRICAAKRSIDLDMGYRVLPSLILDRNDISALDFGVPYGRRVWL